MAEVAAGTSTFRRSAAQRVAFASFCWEMDHANSRFTEM